MRKMLIIIIINSDFFADTSMFILIIIKIILIIFSYNFIEFQITTISCDNNNTFHKLNPRKIENLQKY